MNKKIVTIGCSFTAGITEETDFTVSYPYILSQQNKNIDVYNLSIPGSNVFISNILLEYAIKSIKPDNIVYQITSPGRWLISHEILKTYKPKVIQFSDNYFHLDIKDFKKYFSVFSNTLSAVKKRKNKELENWYQLWHENISYQIQYELYDSSIYKTKSLLNNIDSLVMFWRIKDHQQSNHTDIFSIQAELGNEKFKNFVIDNGDHFGITGNTYILNEIILPKINQ